MRVVPPSVMLSSLEAEHQRWVVNYLRSRPDKLPFTAPCNGAISSRNERTRAYSLGMQLGVPDILVFCAKRGFHGLAIEMKMKKGRISPEQVTYHSKLQYQAGWCVRVCYSAQEAVDLIEWYTAEEGVEDEGTQSI